VFEIVRAIVQVALNAVLRGRRSSVEDGGRAALCLVWPAIYARSWAYWWRIALLLVLLMLTEALRVLVNFMPRRRPSAPADVGIGVTRLGIVTGFRGTRAPCPAGGSGRAGLPRVWSGRGLSP
jgi:hypothetical protein